MERKNKKKPSGLFPVAVAVLLIVGGICGYADINMPSADEDVGKIDTVQPSIESQEGRETSAERPVLDEIPQYSGFLYCEVNDGYPLFDLENLPSASYEEYPELDSLGRCGSCMANIGTDLMPTAERGRIGMIKPSGWHTVRYDDLIADKYLYNRCHLIGFQLTGENANPNNLITGTRYFNVEGMLPLENKVTSYVKTTGNHVLYRVTPQFYGNDLVARGVLMEAYSVEDDGASICFCIFVYNIQPGIEIDYSTGESKRAADYWEPDTTLPF